MRLKNCLSCVSAVLLLGACSSDPELAANHYSSLNDPALYSDSGQSPIPPSARARRAADPYPNSQGVSPDVRTQVRQQESAYAQPQSGGYYASPQARSQVNDELNAEYQNRDQAFGNFTRGQPRTIDLGPGPGLSRISPDTTYGGQTSLYQQPSLSGASATQYTNEVPADAPPLPADARPGDCYELFRQARGYSWQQTACDAQGQGSLVRDLQVVLDRAGYPPGPIDGIFGPRTLRALNAYQRDRGLPVDSDLKPATFRNLGISRR